ncbi:MAG: GNAT family N-acetyltransferase [Pedobacter sp.]|nr:GNAT family N-acetyltransferase [Pedobacter sp.]
MAIVIRKIEKKDNEAIAKLIREIFVEFKIDKPGTVYTDPTTDALFELFEKNQSVFWLAEQNGELVGCCGVYPTDGLPSGCVELVKFYVSAFVRGTGVGRALLEKSITSAQHFGYNEMYLESFPELFTAVSMYKKAGFKQLAAPLGNSGHFACNLWMLLVL